MYRNKTPFLLFLLVFGFMMSACGPKVHVTRLKPAEVSLPTVKRMAIADINGRDGDNLSELITQGLFESPRFEVVERDALRTILGEQSVSLDSLGSGGEAQIGKLLPASALVLGKVNEASYHEDLSRKASKCTKYVKQGDKKKKVEYSCTRYTRTGVASYSAALRVVDTTTGKILATRTFSQADKDTNTAYDQEPREIDGGAMLNRCRNIVATRFIHMVSPYPVQESVRMVVDSKLPDLAVGNGYAMQNDWSKAIEYYTKAVAKADANSALSRKSKGKAHYALGVGLAFSGQYDVGLGELEKAYNLHQSSGWLEMIGRTKQFKAEADKLRQQEAEAAAGAETASLQ